jgi:hypothetical protein
MKRWAFVGGVACFAAACGGQVVHLGTSGDRGQGGDDGGGSASSGDGGASSGGSASSGGGTSSSASGSGGGGASFGGSDEVGADAGGDAVDEATVVEEDGATVTGVAYGNPAEFSTCNANGLIQSGYLFAAPVDLPSTGTVQGLGLIAEQSAVVTMALYALAPAGYLGLVTQTASTSIAAGSTLIPTPPTALPPAPIRGQFPCCQQPISYWIAVEFEETTTVCADGWGAEIQLGMEPYGTFPSIWASTAGTTSSPLNFFVVIN